MRFVARARVLLFEDWRVPFAVLSVFAGLVLVVAVWFFVTLANTTAGLCDLNVARIHDKERHIARTREFLRSPPGAERTGLNRFIRANSLPRLERELALERTQFPEGCDPTERSVR